MKSSRGAKPVAHDLIYMENWSMIFDPRILALTPLSLLTTKNAY
ncbi:MAG: hypothetical protein WAK66_02835 [Methylocystis sp.]